MLIYFFPQNVAALALAAVVIIAGSVRCQNRDCSSWPTSLLVLTTLLLMVMSFRISDPLWVFELGMYVLVSVRWSVALVRREHSYGWTFYLVLLIAAQRLIYPLAYWYEKSAA